MEEKLMPQVFEHEEFGEVRVVMIDGEPWFVAADVCRVLEIKNSSDALRKLDEDELTSVKLRSGGQMRTMNVISEPGLYRLIFSSRKPCAKRFQRWVYHEVLPSIRKTGSYGASDTRILADAISKFAEAISRFADVERENLATLNSEETVRFAKAQLLIDLISAMDTEKSVRSELIRNAANLILGDDSIK